MKSEEGIKEMKERQLYMHGITLVALVITIVILIILATVTINVAFGDGGLIDQAKLAAEKTVNSIYDEEASIANLTAYLNEELGESEIVPPNPEQNEVIDPNPDPEPEPDPEPSTVEEAKNEGTTFEDRTEIEDGVGNKVIIPGGFKIASDSGNTVQQGIVIEDVSASGDDNVKGSQYVWIPIGKFYKDDKSLSNEIVLGRYTFSSSTPGTPQIQQEAYTDSNPENYKTTKVIDTYYTELADYRPGVSNSGTSGLNATAKELGVFINSVKTNKGYYIGRYEATYASGATSSTTVGNYENCKAASKISDGYAQTMSYNPGTLWNMITQLDASKVAINTYEESENVKSDLMNSYAWDTAIVFLQEAGNTNYANQTSKNTSLSNTGNLGGGLKDEACKINDMGSNMMEYTTEYCSNGIYNAAYPCTYRGGYYAYTGNYTASHYYGYATNGSYFVGFRLVLYL